jgi:hypothetical protein
MVVLIAFIGLLSIFVALCDLGRCLEEGRIAFGDIVGMISVSDLSEMMCCVVTPSGWVCYDLIRQSLTKEGGLYGYVRHRDTVI